ncbi:hypothetical protein MJG53_020842, partial [Ovis ammon polii x Ovis aries]
MLPWPLATATSTAPRQCPPGQEPNVVSSPCPSASPGKTVEGWGRDSGLASGSVLTLSLLQEPGRGTLCRSCPPGTFSASWGSRPCQPHSHCSSRGRLEAQEGTATQDALLSPSLPLSCLHPLWCSERGQRVRRGVEVAAGAGSAGETWQPGNSTRAGSPEETAAQYAVIAIVPIFCLMGLLGILVCNLLKRKGYHCTAQKEVGPGPGGGGSGEPTRGSSGEARGPVLAQPSSAWEQLPTENAAALEELLKEYHSRQLVQTGHRPLPRLSPGPPSMPHVCPHRQHLHTVQGPASLSGPCCSRCSQKKWPEVLLSPEAAAATTPAPRLLPNPARTPKAGRQGEITILSVGRFRVARIPEQRVSSVGSEVKTIMEAGPSGSELPNSPRPGLPSEQRALLGSGGSHTKWPKPPAENKAE